MEGQRRAKDLDAAKIAAQKKARCLAAEDLAKKIQEAKDQEKQRAEHKRLQRVRELCKQARRIGADLDENTRTGRIDANCCGHNREPRAMTFSQPENQ